MALMRSNRTSPRVPRLWVDNMTSETPSRSARFLNSSSPNAVKASISLERGESFFGVKSAARRLI